MENNSIKSLKKAGFPAFFVLILFCSLANRSNAQFFVPKLHVGSLAFYQPGIGVEYVVDRQFSLQVNSFYRPSTANENFIMRSFTEDGASKNNKLSGYNFSIEGRAYTRRSRNAATKVYSGFFLRYFNYKLQSEFNRDTVNYQFDASLKNISGGFETGVQWVIDKKYSIDFTFIALGIASNLLKGTVIPDDFEAPIGVLEDEMQGIPFLGNRIILERDKVESLFRFSNDYKTFAVRATLSLGIIF